MAEAGRHACYPYALSIPNAAEVSTSKSPGMAKDAWNVVRLGPLAKKTQWIA